MPIPVGVSAAKAAIADRPLLQPALIGLLVGVGVALWAGPAAACVDDSDCTNPSRPYCDRPASDCVECLVGANCDNGVFCDGVESCNLARVCQPSVDPCEDDPLLVCDEDSESCVPPLDWSIREVYSNADGSIQYVELYTDQWDQHQLGTLGVRLEAQVDATVRTFSFDSNLPGFGDTADRAVLIGSAGYQALPVPPNADYGPLDGGGMFFDPTATTVFIQLVQDGVVMDSVVFDATLLTEECEDSFAFEDGAFVGTLPNSPENYTGDEDFPLTCCTSDYDCPSGGHPACVHSQCNETAQTCFFVPFDEHCDNGDFCDGAETCHVLVGCQSGPDPCAPLSCDEDVDLCTTEPTYVTIDPVDFDRWMYPLNDTPGTRDLAPTFGYFTDTSFDNKDGQLVIAVDTAAAGIPAGQGPSMYNDITVRVTATHFMAAAPFLYDPTYDAWQTYLAAGDPDHVPDTDPGRPIELYGVGVRAPYLPPLSFGPPTPGPVHFEETERFCEGCGGFGQGVRNVFALGFDASGTEIDVSSNVAAGFDPTSWAIGVSTSGLAPGDPVPQGSPGVSTGETFEFVVDTSDPHVLAYVQEGLDAGLLAFSIVSMHTAQQGQSTANPNFYTRESGDPAAHPPSVEVAVTLPEPGTAAGLLAGALLLSALHRRRTARTLSRAES